MLTNVFETACKKKLQNSPNDDAATTYVQVVIVVTGR